MHDRDYETKKSTKIYVSNLDTAVSLTRVRSLSTICAGSLRSPAASSMSSSSRRSPSASPSSSTPPSKRQKMPFNSNSPPLLKAPRPQLPLILLTTIRSNGQSLLEREMKVYFAKGSNEKRGNFQDRGRGRPYGDRGGYGGQSSFEPRRREVGGNDRPRGCFNCGEEGHMAKDCSKRTV